MKARVHAAMRLVYHKKTRKKTIAEWILSRRSWKESRHLSVVEMKFVDLDLTLVIYSANFTKGI